MISEIKLREIYEEMDRRLRQAAQYMNQKELVNYQMDLREGAICALMVLTGAEWPEVHAMVEKLEAELDG